MTRYRPHHLPEPDNDAFEKTLQSLSRRGLKLTTTRRIVLATAHRFGWFDGPDGIAAILRDALEYVPTVPPEIVARREVEDRRRPADPDTDVEDRYHHTLTSAPKPHPWRLIDEGRGFHCEGCHTSHGRYVSPDQSVDAARDHVKTCPKAVRDER